MNELDGLILVNKPKGRSSFSVVYLVRALIKRKFGKKVKVGHCGTLDPQAEGLLIILVGKYTKKAEEFLKKDKVYQVEATLGQTSTTGDIEGDIIQKSHYQPTLHQVEEAVAKFVGDTKQRPPVYSAIKINGQRAYNLARKGQEVEMPMRSIHIDFITIDSYEYPKVKFTARVSSGTYIRSLVEDIGESLGTGAYMSALNRTSIDKYSIKDALTLDQLDTYIEGLTDD